MASPTTAQRVCPRCSGPVGLAEMNSTLTGWPASVSLRPYAAPASTTCAATAPCAPASTRDVEEARAGDLDARRCRRRPRSRAASRLGEVARVGARPSWPAAARRWWRSRRAPGCCGRSTDHRGGHAVGQGQGSRPRRGPRGRRRSRRRAGRGSPPQGIGGACYRPVRARAATTSTRWAGSNGLVR